MYRKRNHDVKRFPAYLGNFTIEENVLVQIESLQTKPFASSSAVARKTAANTVDYVSAICRFRHFKSNTFVPKSMAATTTVPISLIRNQTRRAVDNPY